MAEYFSRASLSPDGYDPNTWVSLYDVKTTTLGAMIFDFSITNTSSDKDITIEAKLVDRDGSIIHYILGPTTLKKNGISWDNTQKVVLMPGDRLLVKASDRGACFYASILTNVKTF